MKKSLLFCLFFFAVLAGPVPVYAADVAITSVGQSTDWMMVVALIRGMARRGYNIQRDVHIGTVQGILLNSDTGIINGGADSRRLGLPVGY